MSDTSNNRIRIIDSFIKANGNILTRTQFLDNFTISDPVRATGLLPRKNSLVKITPKIESKYYGIKTVWYNRVHVTQLGQISVTRTTETRVVDLLPQINAKYSLLLSESDVINNLLLPSQTGTFFIILPISPTSLMFYDGDFIVIADETAPVNPEYPAGTLLSFYCVGYNKHGIFADGNGGTYDQLIQTDSPDCGYDPSNNIYLIIDGGDASTDYIESWQQAGTAGAG